MKTLLFLFLFFSLAFTPILSAHAANPCTDAPPIGQSSTLPQCVNQVYVWSLGVGTLLALLVIIGGGYRIMSSRGNAEQATSGKEMVYAAILGLVLLFGAYLLLKTINPDLVNFNLDSLNGLQVPQNGLNDVNPPNGPRN